MQIRTMTSRRPVALQASFLQPVGLVVAPISGLMLTAVAALAGMLGIWRSGADPGWTTRFFIAGGLFSRYQLWLAIAIGAQASAFMLERWVANRNTDPPTFAA
jgi:hypothetical protein